MRTTINHTLLWFLNNLKLVTLLSIIAVPALSAHAFPHKLSQSTEFKLGQSLTQEEKRWLASHPIIRVGVKNNWKPVEFITEEKRFRGVTVDYLSTIAPLLGVKFEMVDIEEKPKATVDLLSSVSNLGFAGHEKYRLTDSILQFNHAIYTHKGNNNIRNMEDLVGKKVSVFKYGQLVKSLESRFSGIKLMKIEIVDQAFAHMDNGQSDAYIGNEMVIDYEAKLQGIGYLDKVGYAPVNTQLKMAVRKDWPILLSILNKSFAAVQPEQKHILKNWHLARFKDQSRYTSIFIGIFLFLASYILFKSYNFKRILNQQKLEAKKESWHHVNHDTQTGLANRRFFISQVTEAVKQADDNNTLVGLLSLDIDAFKHVNELHGRTVGDLMITQIAERLIAAAHPFDQVSRLAGDEFTVILTDIADDAVVESTALRIQASLQRPFHINQLVLNITSSVGSAIYANDANDIDVLIKHADMAMSEAKRQGKNCYRPFTQSMQDVVSHKHKTSTGLRNAIIEKEFKLHYQPIVALASHKVVKAEALIRWQHPEKGLISPLEFIKIAEESNAITKIGHWVFNQALKDVQTLQEQLHESFSVSFNVSPKQLGTESLLIQWPALLKERNIPPNSIGIEITEGLLLEPNNNTIQILADIRASGAKILIDDFGTGYSSFSYLKQLDVDMVKIDQSFIKNLSIGSDDMVLCETIITMAHKLGLEVIAEGIENAEQSALLLKMGCDYGQGYFFSKPKSLGDLIASQSTS